MKCVQGMSSSRVPAACPAAGNGELSAYWREPSSGVRKEPETQGPLHFDQPCASSWTLRGLAACSGSLLTTERKRGPAIFSACIGSSGREGLSCLCMHPCHLCTAWLVPGLRCAFAGMLVQVGTSGVKVTTVRCVIIPLTQDAELPEGIGTPDSDTSFAC